MRFKFDGMAPVLLMPGVMKDLKIISVRLFFNRFLHDSWPDGIPSFQIGAETFDWCYYLVDGICRNFMGLVYSFGDNADEHYKHLNVRQEGVGKCVERIFVVLNK